LTGLYNRRYLDETIGREVTHVHRAGLPLSVAVLDVDGFKNVNDTHGHAAGDRVLQRTADVLRENVRGSDLVCRSGGDEFIVVMPGATLDTAVARAESWRAAAAAGPVTARDGVPVAYTLSIGVALHANQNESFQACMDRADAALFAAKRAGRDRVVAAEGP